MKYVDLLCACFLMLCLLIHYPALSQNTATKEDSISNNQDAFLTYYPLLFYFPETRLGFGAALVYNYYPGESQKFASFSMAIGCGIYPK